jgi:hypothetical protein
MACVVPGGLRDEGCAPPDVAIVTEPLRRPIYSSSNAAEMPTRTST